MRPFPLGLLDPAVSSAARMVGPSVTSSRPSSRAERLSTSASVGNLGVLLTQGGAAVVVDTMMLFRQVT